jgi:tannase/feruloyl esterase
MTRTLSAALIALLLATAHAHADETHCSSIRGLAGPTFVVEAAEAISAGATPASANGPPGVALPAHCRVQGTLNPRRTPSGESFGIGFELRLPENWNGRFLLTGGGGLDGVLNPALGNVFGTLNPPALSRGFAVASTDGGHRGTSMLDARFALDQQARLDYAFNAVDKVTLKAKELITAYYGRAPQRSYFLGCSNGGRQGMLAAQRFPEYFDGIVAGAPIFNMSRIVANQIWNVQVLTRIAPRDASGAAILSRALTDKQLESVSTAALQACDALDGIADGMINDFKACRFDPATLQCSAKPGEACLSSAQVSALKDIFSGARNSRGESLYGRYPFDTGIAQPVWRRMHLGTSATAKSDASDVVLGVETLRYYMLTPPDPAFDPLKFDFDRDLARLRQTQALGDADGTFLRTFAARGKLILYHGLSDQGMAAGALADWYDRVKVDTGGHPQDWARLFFVPGMTHCGGGQSTDRFDMLTAIQSWVERGEAPDRISATGAALPGVTRPLCPYPKVARFDGGDAKRESSFTCRE